PQYSQGSPQALRRRGTHALRSRGRPPESAAGLALVRRSFVDDRVRREALGGLSSLVGDLVRQLDELVLVSASALSFSILLVGHAVSVPLPLYSVTASCGRGGIGKRDGFRTRWAKALGGSSPLARTCARRSGFCLFRACFGRAGSSLARGEADAAGTDRGCIRPSWKRDRRHRRL